MSIQDSYLGLSRLLCYPESKDGLLEICDGIAESLRGSAPDAPAPPSAAFAELLRNTTLSELQEDYVASFDFNPKGALYLGHHLYGDSPKKRTFMIALKQEFARHDFTPPGNELPDHLALLLGFLAHLASRGEESYRRDFIVESVLPGLNRMVAADPTFRPPHWQSLMDIAEQLCSRDCEEVTTC
jgi:nitrate reductase molybdenum cofactor assembly chaperone NarJ/NarW